MGNLGVSELVIILLIVIVIFGATRLPQLGKGLGEGIRNFKSSLKTGEDKEIEDEASFQAAVEAQADIIMLDNRSPIEMKQMIQWLDKRRPRDEPGRPILEASGGITLKNVRQVAKTGVDWISLGALTHSAPALDISMEIQILA